MFGKYQTGREQDSLKATVNNFRRGGLVPLFAEAERADSVDGAAKGVNWGRAEIS